MLLPSRHGRHGRVQPSPVLRGADDSRERRWRGTDRRGAGAALHLRQHELSRRGPRCQTLVLRPPVRGYVLEVTLGTIWPCPACAKASAPIQRRRLVMAHTVPANERNDIGLAVAAISPTIALVTGTCWLVCHCMWVAREEPNAPYPGCPCVKAQLSFPNRILRVGGWHDRKRSPWHSHGLLFFLRGRAGFVALPFGNMG